MTKASHRSLGYFEARFDSPISVAPERRYAIFSSQRTGSNYLCARLNNLKDRLGRPMEYLHPDAINIIGGRLFPGGKRRIGLRDYLDAVARVRSTGDGWFGTKIQPGQLMALVDGDFGKATGFLSGFDRLIFMTRRDKLQQAISGAIAYATGAWFNFGGEPSLDQTNLAQLVPVIDRLQVEYADEEKLMLAMREKLAGRPQMQIVYEDILEDADAVFLKVVEFFGIERDALGNEEITTAPTEKPPGKLAERIRSAYLNRVKGNGTDPGGD